MTTECGRNIILGCTGSVAVSRVIEIAKRLHFELEASVRLVPTQNALFFFNAFKIELENLKSTLNIDVYTDNQEWEWKGFGDPVLHIDLKKWADLMIIAPMDANSLAKIANGMADNLLTCIMRAWDVGRKPMIFALAMNSAMLSHPSTCEHVSKLESWGFVQVPPISKMLACGDYGPGGIADTDDIIAAAKKALKIFS